MSVGSIFLTIGIKILTRSQTDFILHKQASLLRRRASPGHSGQYGERPIHQCELKRGRVPSVRPGLKHAENGQ
jgi:hypothetical protein